MLQSKKRLLELNAKLADTLTSKGVTASTDETTTALVDKVSDISSGGDDSVLVSLIDRSIESLVIPDGVTKIGKFAFRNCISLTSITIPDSVTIINSHAFYDCTSLTRVTIPDSVKNIDISAFQYCTSLKSITIPNSIHYIMNNTFLGCTSLKSVTVPKGVIYISSGAFKDCTSLESITISNSVETIVGNAFDGCTAIVDVTLEHGFNANLKISASTLIKRETMVNMFNALADRTGLTAYTLTLNQAVADKLTDEDKAIPTAKNWTIVYK